MNRALRTALAVTALLAAFSLFLFSALATAADGQGAVVFVFTLPAMLALLGFSAWMARQSSRPAFRLSLGGFGFLAAFFVCAFLPGLNLFPAAVVGVVGGGYKAIYGVTPYEAHHRNVDLGGLIGKALEAQGGATLDLRGLGLPYEWKRLCVFGPYATDEAAWAAGLPKDWPLSTYSKAGLDDGVNAMVLVGDRYPVLVADLRRSLVEFPDSVRGRCVEKAAAVFHRTKEAGGGLGPTLELAR
jgi:hypothetical protein